MYKFISLTPSKDKVHKYEVIIQNTKTNRNKTIKFGAYGYNDYIQYNKEVGKVEADKKKSAYIARHKVNENFNDETTKGFWALHILWNKDSLEESLKDTVKKFNLK
jgi:hypothetical protein